MVILILFFFGCYLADGKETLENINEKFFKNYQWIVSSMAYEITSCGVFSEK